MIQRSAGHLRARFLPLTVKCLALACLLAGRATSSADAAAATPELYEEVGDGVLGELLPRAMFEVHAFGLALWQWLGLAALLLLAYAMSWLLTQLVYRLGTPIVRRTASSIDDEMLQAVARPLRFVFGLGVFALGALALRLVPPLAQMLYGVEKVLAIVGAAWMALRIMDVLSAHVARRLAQQGRTAAVSVVPLGRRTVKVFLLLIALISMLQNFGVNVTGLIAGLGIGGLAVALAAQKTVENFFGGVSLIADQPVRVGDFCRFSGDQLGTVEEIGLRSTRVRTLDRTVVTIPNADFSQRAIENFGARDRLRLRTLLNLRAETTPDQLRYLLVELRRLLISHPRVIRDSVQVRFVAFGVYSLDVEVVSYVDTADWKEFLGVREDLYLRILELIAESGSGLAFPSQVLYMRRDTGLDERRAHDAEQNVRQWRERGELPFPDFAAETVLELAGTGDFPPRGSVDTRRAS